jgi:hypothetical protein
LQRRATASVATDTCSSSPDIPPRTASPSADSVSRFCSGAALLPENKQTNKQANKQTTNRQRDFDAVSTAHTAARREGGRAAGRHRAGAARAARGPTWGTLSTHMGYCEYSHGVLGR